MGLFKRILIENINPALLGAEEFPADLLSDWTVGLEILQAPTMTSLWTKNDLLGLKCTLKVQICVGNELI